MNQSDENGLFNLVLKFVTVSRVALSILVLAREETAGVRVVLTDRCRWWATPSFLGRQQFISDQVFHFTDTYLIDS